MGSTWAGVGDSAGGKGEAMDKASHAFATTQDGTAARVRVEKSDKVQLLEKSPVVD
jgi:hypothetical protein